MRIEPVTRQSLPLLEQGLRALAVDLGDPYAISFETLEKALFGPHRTCDAQVAVDSGQLRGVALHTPVMSTTLGGVGAYISDLWVAPEARGTALATRLLAAVARRSEAGFLRLSVYQDNPRAAAFYRRLGYQPKTGEHILQLSGARLDDLVRTG